MKACETSAPNLGCRGGAVRAETAGRLPGRTADAGKGTECQKHPVRCISRYLTGARCSLSTVFDERPTTLTKDRPSTRAVLVNSSRGSFEGLMLGASVNSATRHSYSELRLADSSPGLSSCTSSSQPGADRPGCCTFFARPQSLAQKMDL